jgi:hypothetical protein
MDVWGYQLVLHLVLYFQQVFDGGRGLIVHPMDFWLVIGWDSL